MTLSIARRAGVFAAASAMGILALAGCSSNNNSSPTESPTTAATSATSSPTNNAASCTEESILNALPSGSTMVRYHCADVSGTQWAAAEISPGPTVYFLEMTGDQWSVSTSDSICGTASAGLPDALLSFCPGSSPTTSPTSSGVSCTASSILGALPSGATMVRYHCANVAGTQWAAARVNPGPTTYFLKSSGSSWNVITKDQVCGTASSGLPESLLAYCS